MGRSFRARVHLCGCRRLAGSSCNDINSQLAVALVGAGSMAGFAVDDDGIIIPHRAAAACLMPPGRTLCRAGCIRWMCVYRGSFRISFDYTPLVKVGY